MAGIIPLMVPTTMRMVVATITMVWRDEQVDIRGIGV